MNLRIFSGIISARGVKFVKLVITAGLVTVKCSIYMMWMIPIFMSILEVHPFKYYTALLESLVASFPEVFRVITNFDRNSL